MSHENTIKRMAAYIVSKDIDEDVCKKVQCNSDEEDLDIYDCIDCVIAFFSKDCKWEYEEVCVNDKSEHCADFVSSEKCGSCKVREV